MLQRERASRMIAGQGVAIHACFSEVLADFHRGGDAIQVLLSSLSWMLKAWELCVDGQRTMRASLNRKTCARAHERINRCRAELLEQLCRYWKCCCSRAKV